MNYSKILSAVAIVALTAASAWADELDLYPDTWVAIDGLGRQLPTAADAPLRTDKERTVGIFYVSWHYDWFYTNFKSPYACDVTKILEQDPSARLDYNHPLWTHEFAYHWGEPELGYFTSCDPYVIRKDMSMLVDAGVDVLILDCTNAVCYFEEWDALLNTMTAMKAEGHKVPQVCFWGYNGEVAERLTDIYKTYYAKGRYQDLWFYWDGKPLMLYNENASYSQEFKDFFTLRHMWWGYYVFNGKRYVGTEDHWCFGYDMHDTTVNILTPQQRASTHQGRLEQMCVTPAQHATTMVGKSYTLAAGEPTLNDHDLPQKKFLNRHWIDHPEYYGFYFQERWNEAISADPDFIYINDWNEWIAGQFYSEAGVTFMGRPGSNFQFVDQYNAEFNRTIQPMKGGATDNYYMQMVDGIRRYKGVREAPLSVAAYEIGVSADMSAWDKVGEEYLDTPGDVLHRNYTGYGGNRYSDDSGRNDIVRAKVNICGGNACFYVEAAGELTPWSDPNWMLLYVNADSDYSTGWHGFDCLINKEVKSATETTLMRWDDDAAQWQEAATLPMRVEGNRLVVEVPLAALGIADPDAGSFYFKWADNPADPGDIISLCTSGDTAPNRRFCYNYRWNHASMGVAPAVADRRQPLRVTALTGGAVRVECDGRFIVSNLLGAVVAAGEGGSTVLLPSAGFYLVATDRTCTKIFLP